VLKLPAGRAPGSSCRLLVCANPGRWRQTPPDGAAAIYLASPPVVIRWCWTVRSTSGADSYRSTSWVVHVVAGELADFAPVGQSAFCQGWQLCVKNAASLGWIITTSGPVLMLLSMMWVSLRLFSLTQ
jgi:hypothetical protein